MPLSPPADFHGGRDDLLRVRLLRHRYDPLLPRGADATCIAGDVAKTLRQHILEHGPHHERLDPVLDVLAPMDHGDAGCAQPRLALRAGGAVAARPVPGV